MTGLSSGHPWTVTLFCAISVSVCLFTSLLVCSRKWFSVLSSSLGGLHLHSEDVADVGCTRAARESVSARWSVGPLLHARLNR